MKTYEVWLEGFSATGESGPAEWLGKHSAISFQKACFKAAAICLGDMEHYSAKDNTYWGCRFFDNEADARRSFG